MSSSRKAGYPSTVLLRLGVLCVLVLAAVEPAIGSDENVILVTVDTLRADRLGCYGYPKGTTPNIDRLASEGTQFRSAYSQVPFTLPSHASLFTSTYPGWNGIQDSSGPPLEKGTTTLAGILQQQGYTTAGFPAAFVLDEFFGLNQGFSYYYSHFPHRESPDATEDTGIRRTADEQLKRSLDWIHTNAQRKFFAWIHLYDTHHPYAPPASYRARYGDSYDAEVAYVDWAIGALRQFLRQEKLEDRTIIVLTADHGEGLGDHGELYHGYFVYDSTLHVPLIIFDPQLNTPAREVPQVVRLLDVTPTILQLLGITRSEQMQGQSLVPFIEGKSLTDLPAYGESLFANRHFGWSELHSLRFGRYKLILSPNPELYDVQNDPQEKANLYHQKPAIAAVLRQQFQQIVARYSPQSPSPDPSNLDHQALANLRSLGYIGTPPESPQQLSGSLPDPKDKLQLYNLYLQGLSEHGAGDLTKAVATYERLLVSDSGPSIVYHELGNLYFELHNYSKAIDSFRAAIERSPRSEPYLLDLGRAYGAMGSFQKAADTYRTALAVNPEDAAAANNLAVMYMKLNRWDKAAETLEEAVRRGSHLRETYYHLGVCYQRAKRLDDAAQQFRTAIEIDNGFAPARYNLGTVEALQGKDELAIEEFRLAINTNPNFPEAHFDLGVLYARRGDPAKGMVELRTATELRPNFTEAHFNLGILYLQHRNLDAAMKEFNSAISARPDFIEAHRGLQRVYEEKGLSQLASSEMNVVRRLSKNEH